MWTPGDGVSDNHVVYPEFNSLTIFVVDHSKMHFVAPVSRLAPAEPRRVAVGGWWSSAEPPAELQLRYIRPTLKPPRTDRQDIFLEVVPPPSPAAGRDGAPGSGERLWGCSAALESPAESDS
jgi:hypothetical protein